MTFAKQRYVEALRTDIANLKDAFEFRMKSHEKIVPMGAGEISGLIKRWGALADALERGRKAHFDGVVATTCVHTPLIPERWRLVLLIELPEEK